MISYIKVYGPPLLKALEALRAIAIDMPEVCIMDTGIQTAFQIPDASPNVSVSSEPGLDTLEGIMTFFRGAGEISEKRCQDIISKQGERLGEFDFFFEWLKPPSMEQLESLIGQIDESLEPIGVKYTITTR